MGILISRFRRKKSTKEQLQSIEKEIKSIHEFRVHTEQRQKRFVGALIAYSVLLYICASLAFYFYYFPEEVSQMITYGIPLLLFPVVVWFLKEFIRWYYQCKLRNNDTKLTELLKRKRKILDEVMETETYLVARELLEKYDPDQLRKKSQEKEDILEQMPGVELRRRTIAATTSGKASPVPPVPLTSRGQGQIQPSAFSSFPGQMARNVAPNIQGLRPPGPPMARPILPRDRNFLDRMIEYLVGDGPTSRYALICRQCQSHNGMALQEEFEFIAFRCCYCYYWNPARKQRSTAPRLPEQLPLVLSSSSEDPSGAPPKADESQNSYSSGAEDSESAKGTDEDGEVDEEKDAQGDVGTQAQSFELLETPPKDEIQSTDCGTNAESEQLPEDASDDIDAKKISNSGTDVPEANAVNSVGDCL